MPEYHPLAVERQVFLIGIWRSVTLNDIFLKEIQIQEERITDKICQLQLSPTGLFVFPKTGNYSTGLENGIPLYKIYSIASKKSKPEHLLCIIDEDIDGKFAVVLLRCNTLKDSFLIQNTMKELWNVCFMSDKLVIKSEPSGRVRSVLRSSYGSENSWQKSDSEKSDEVYTSGSLITMGDFARYQSDTQNYMETIREELHMIFSEISNVKKCLKNNDMLDEQTLENINNMEGMKYLKAISRNDEKVKKIHPKSEDSFDIDILKASKLSDNENEEYILLRNDLMQKSHDGYFQGKSIRYKPDYLHSDPLYVGTKEKNLNSQMEIMESSVFKGNSTAKGRKPGHWTFLQELFDLDPHGKDSITKRNGGGGGGGGGWTTNEKTFAPYHTKSSGIDYMRMGVQKPIEDVYRRRDSQVVPWDTMY